MDRCEQQRDVRLRHWRVDQCEHVRQVERQHQQRAPHPTWCKIHVLRDSSEITLVFPRLNANVGCQELRDDKKRIRCRRRVDCCSVTFRAGAAARGRGGRGGGRGPVGAQPLVIDDQAGFKPIFDGTSLKGWEGDPAFWKAVDGAIVGQSTPENAVKENTFLIWRGGEPRDFELKLQFRMSSTNSGIQVRSVHLPPGTPSGNGTVQGQWVMKGYQADIDFNNTYTGRNL